MPNTIRGFKRPEQLVSGFAELFATELSLDKPYTISHRKFAIFTWHGCELEVLFPFLHKLFLETLL